MIYNEDCLITMSKLGTEVDLILTSPPYDSMREYNGYSFDFENTAKELYRVLKPGGVLVWVVGDQTIKGSESGTSFRQALYFKEIGFNLHDTMIYQKVGCAFTPKNKYYQMFEYMFVFSKGVPKTFNPIQVPRTGHTYGSVGTEKRGTKKEVKYDSTKTTRNAGNVWIIANHSRNASSDEFAYEHPAIFPEKLAENHILSWTNPGDLVYDCFGGAGTTAKMAKKLGRNFIISEISSEYCEIIEKRIAFAD